MSSVPNNPLTPEQEESLRDSLKRCSPETITAAIAFRNQGDNSQAPMVIIGIIERFCEPDVRPKLKEPGADELRVAEDLGVDSLTMVEVVMLVEEALEITIDNSELGDLRTIGDVKTFVGYKLSGEAMPEPAKNIESLEIPDIMPHGDPFLFVQQAAIRGDEITGSYKISGEEDFLRGHFKDNPVFPASIMLEALGQLAVLYLLRADDEALAGKVDPSKILFTSCDGVRCSRVCKPGDTLSMSVKAKKIRHPGALFTGTILVDSEKAVFAEEISLKFDYAEGTVVAQEAEGESADKPAAE
ncbi:MAG: phosphopantetheine-binding protein [Verrucomicrobiota bacterium]